MIEVTYWPERNRVTITGHANSDVYGKDLVCAAVSALALTLAANARYLASKDHVTDFTVRLAPGDAEICCKPKTIFRE